MFPGGAAMLATQTPDNNLEGKEVKQIKERLAKSLKALQKRYITSDAVVTSEDGDANLLCCALEAIFIHGIKSKFIRSESGSRNRKGDRGPLPQPFFWSLLKTVTHRDVITELEKLSFVGTDVGRCRAWLRLALNHGLLECYLASLFREDSKLQAHYQPSALLLNPEEREVLLSYLQGLSSLTFSLSYKSAVLNQWTTTPLALAGLCPLTQADSLDLNINGDQLTSEHKRKESWDTASQSSSSSDALDAQREASFRSRGSGGRTASHSSNLSLDTSGSSQLSSSLDSDSLLQGPTGEQWSSGDLETALCSKKTSKEVITDFRESGNCSQDSMREDSIVSSTGADPFSESATFSSSDSETQPPMPQVSADPEPAEPAPCEEPPAVQAPAETLTPVCEQVEETPAGIVSVQEIKPAEEKSLKSVVDPSSERSGSIVSRKVSTGSISHSHSWISEDDIYKPNLEELPDSDEVSSPSGTPTEDLQSPPSVVHRRQIGLSNPFRGLLKLGHLERRGAMGMWWDYYCELSPFEFRLYLNAEERTCCDNCSLLRCEEARVTSAEGRFELAFPGKRFYLRAANRDEAEDWVDRVVEAVNKCRPASRGEEPWEVLSPASPLPSSPDSAQEAAVQLPQCDWTHSAQLESDALKQAVLYFSADSNARTWTPLVFSLSLETLKGFQVEEGRKLLRLSFPIHQIRDVVPDVSLGGPAFLKLLTVKETLRLRAENPEEARSWRDLIRRALDSYLESGEETSLCQSGLTGNLQRLVQHRLKEDAALLTHLCAVPAEKGLDAQSFRCADCPQQIGPSLGKTRLCEFSGLYYCESCHHGDTTIIPARMLHNWDVAQREVSKRALRLLAKVEQEPLLNLDQLNPELVKHSESMWQADSLRQRLQLLGNYLLTCRSAACKQLQSSMGQRSYVLESSHLYSVMDLRQIAEDQYAGFLIKLVQRASDHVLHCDLCTQRGFICQTCHSDDIIFPFQFDSTTRCRDCKAVFHLSCKPEGSSCPRCVRMKKYLERILQD